MVQKTQKQKPKGYLFDDTPRGLLEMLLVGGGIVVALSAAPAAIFALAGVGYALKAEDKARRRKLDASLQYLKRRQYVQVEKSEGKWQVRLTEKGRSRAQAHIDRRALIAPPRPKHWDGKWRVILFDIAAEERSKRNAFRSLVRRLGAVLLQKSVWVHPFDCSPQILLLKQHFGFSEDEIRLIVADSVGDDKKLRAHFKL